MCEKEMSTQELFDKITEKIIIKLEEGEITCPNCKGLKMIYTQKGEQGLVHTCSECYTGKVFVCEYCGELNKTDLCQCVEAREKRQSIRNDEELKKKQIKFYTAKRIKFADYEGKFLTEDIEFIQDSDEIYGRLYDQIKYDKLTDEELPNFLWGTRPEPVFNLDITEIICSKCEDGYEDMNSCLDMDSDDLSKAQAYLDKWYRAQGDSLNIYYEDFKVVVLLEDLIKEIRDDISNE
ncbi:hypothetical protein [Clostridium tagluense]|uniref:Uncharacterized protein n=1 Tax=Clostridium tagluense TaxID=360422 RepID=A0A401UTL0_9CLOT|nr:hypothetical protein [Clostridium tagluense]GCD12890.1 hypothetical protein Ctaglu_45130 [Clostridium tagluense]